MAPHADGKIPMGDPTPAAGVTFDPPALSMRTPGLLVLPAAFFRALGELKRARLTPSPATANDAGAGAGALDDGGVKSTCPCSLGDTDSTPSLPPPVDGRGGVTGRLPQYSRCEVAGRCTKADDWADVVPEVRRISWCT